MRVFNGRAADPLLGRIGALHGRAAGGFAHHQVQVVRGTGQQAAAGRIGAVEGTGRRARIDQMQAVRQVQHHAGAVDHREPAGDAGVGGERAILRDLGHADAQQPIGRRGPGQQLARAAAAIAPGLRWGAGQGHGLQRHGANCPSSA
ncbi:MAG: hypothetical protein HY021_12805 [Burkholderiales bacterium]|nr:hypothetical protein [Burkholderiales bacterium]